MFSAPIRTAPARRRAATACASRRAGGRSRLILEPASVVIPATSKRSLTANGSPASGPASRPAAIAASTPSASAPSAAARAVVGFAPTASPPPGKGRAPAPVPRTVTAAPPRVPPQGDPLHRRIVLQQDRADGERRRDRGHEAPEGGLSQLPDLDLDRCPGAAVHTNQPGLARPGARQRVETIHRRGTDGTPEASHPLRPPPADRMPGQ